MLNKFNNIFYSALSIFRHFHNFGRSMFTKSLNRETCNFLAAKNQFTNGKVFFLFFSFFFILRPISGVTIKPYNKGEKRESTLYTLFYYCISTYVVLELNIGFSGTSNFRFTKLPSLQSKMYSNILRMV